MPDPIVADPTPAPAPAPAPEWYATADAETRGYLQNRGWDKLPPAEVALKAAQAHREAERYIGVPADKLVRLADPTDAVAYRSMWNKLGAPGDPTKYDLSDIRTASGEPFDPEFTSYLQKVFDEANVPLPQARAVAQAFVKFRDQSVQATYEEQQQLLAQNKDALAKNWGVNVESNTFVAKQAAQKLGVSPEAVAALEGQVGYPAVMEMFRKIGEQMGEARFITNTLPNGNTAVFTADGAAAKIAELKADPVFMERYLNGGSTSAEFNQMQRLIEQTVGQRFSDIRAA